MTVFQSNLTYKNRQWARFNLWDTLCQPTLEREKNWGRSLFYLLLFFLSSPEDMPIDFRKRGKEREKDGKIDVEEKISLLPHIYAPTRTKPTAQTCALTGN